MDWSKMDFGGLGGGLSDIFGGLFGDSGAPYEDYQKELSKYFNQAQGYQNPFFNAGSGAIPQFQEWLGGMKNPNDFINNLMGKYQESPWAKYQQEQSIRAGQNAGSRGDMNVGGTGSTPMAQFLQDNARNISSQDMQNWLGRVLGINTEYGQGLNNEINRGQGSANAMTNFLGDYGNRQAEASMGQRARENQDRNNLWGGLFNVGASIAPMFL
jgi:hypothetical protein